MDEWKWIEEETKLNQIPDFGIVPETMSSIEVQYIYINQDLEIEDKVVETVDLEIKDGNAWLSKERVLYLVQNRKIYTPTTQYKFIFGLLYNIDILPAHLQSFVREDPDSFEKSPFLKEITIVEDICIAPSLPIFHSIHSIYFFFKESVLKKMVANSLVANSLKTTAKVKPILKTDTVPPKEKQTKRVRIQEILSANKSKKKRISLDS